MQKMLFWNEVKLQCSQTYDNSEREFADDSIVQLLVAWFGECLCEMEIFPVMVIVGS